MCVRERSAADAMHTRDKIKIIVLRCIFRLALIGIIVLLFKHLPLEEGLSAYIQWADEQSEIAVPLVFVICVAFNSISPTGYLTTVLAGATFDIKIAAPLAYAIVNTAAMINLLLVRKCCTPLFDWCGSCTLSPLLARKIALKRRHAMEHFSWINEFLIAGGDFRTCVSHVVLLRLPFLWNGILNYVISYSSVKPLPYAIGNAIGFLPGSVLFAIIGTQARSLFQLVEDGVGGKELALVITWLVLVIIALFGLAFWGKRFFRSHETATTANQIGAPGGEVVAPGEKPGEKPGDRLVAVQDAIDDRMRVAESVSVPEP